MRFLSVSPYGAVLEALGKLDYATVPFEIPVGKSKGKYVRIAGPNDKEHLVANFECSINLDKVRLAMCHIARCMPTLGRRLKGAAVCCTRILQNAFPLYNCSLCYGSCVCVYVSV